MPRLWPVPRIIGNERNRAGPGIDLGFGNEFCTRAISPVSEDYGCEGTLSIRNDEVCVDWTIFGTRVGNIEQPTAFELPDDFFRDVDRLLRVVVEQTAGNLKTRMPACYRTVQRPTGRLPKGSTQS